MLYCGLADIWNKMNVGLELNKVGYICYMHDEIPMVFYVFLLVSIIYYLIIHPYLLQSVDIEDGMNSQYNTNFTQTVCENERTCAVNGKSEFSTNMV